MKAHLNLLPLAYRRGQLIRRRVWQWSAIWLLAVAAGGLLLGVQWRQYQADLTQLAKLRRDSQPVVDLRAEIGDIRSRLDELQQREALALALADERSLLTLIGFLSDAARGAGGGVSIESLQLTRGSPDAPDVNSLLLNGVGVDDVAVSRFAAALRNQQAFKNVELKSTGGGQVGDVPARTYSLECSF